MQKQYKIKENLRRSYHERDIKSIRIKKKLQKF